MGGREGYSRIHTPWLADEVHAGTGLQEQCGHNLPAAMSPQCCSSGCMEPNNPRGPQPRQEGRPAPGTSRTIGATSRHNSPWGSQGGWWTLQGAADCYRAMYWACSSMGTPSPHHGQDSPQHRALVVSYVEGAIMGQSVAGERRGGRAVSQGWCCLFPVPLPLASAWSPGQGCSPSLAASHTLSGPSS